MPEPTAGPNKSYIDDLIRQVVVPAIDSCRQQIPPADTDEGWKEWSELLLRVALDDVRRVSHQIRHMAEQTTPIKLTPFDYHWSFILLMQRKYEKDRRINDAIQETYELLTRHSTDSVLTQEELKFLISELHGVIQGRLVALSLIAAGVTKGTRDPAVTHALMIKELDELLDTGMPDLLKVTSTRDLWEPVVSQTLLDITELWQRALTITLHYDELAAASRIESSAADLVCVVVGEGITNAAKHGRASHCRIDISCERVVDEPKIQVTVTITDDGQGLAAPASFTEGIGLALIRKANTYSHSVTAGEQGGTELRVTIEAAVKPDGLEADGLEADSAAQAADQASN